MPSFTSAVSDLVSVGPVLDVQIAVPLQVEQLFAAQNRPVPSPISVSLMVDTGASNSVIKAGLAQQLGLQPVGVVSVDTPSSANVPCPQYSIRLLLPKGVVAVVTAIETPLDGQNIHGLVGRDLLQHAVFVYLGAEDQFTLSF